MKKNNVAIVGNVTGEDASLLNNMLGAEGMSGLYTFTLYGADGQPEQDALKGAARHIAEEKPRLLISTYHKPEDLFQIPRLIDSMRNDYTYYLRFNGKGLWPCDHVLFAV